jgi:hypothetical protein
MATVGSKIDKRFNYKETKDLDDDTDYDEESDIYNILFHNKTINVIFGKKIHRANRGKLCYIFIYLCENDALKEKIGLYEFSSKDEADFINKDGSIKLDKFIHPLWFSDFIKDEEEKGKSASKSSVEIKDIRGSHSDWIDKFMEDPMFGVTETNDDGSCFFDAIRIALESAGIKMTILQLRSLIADSPGIVGYYNDRLGIFGPAVLELINQWNNGENVEDTIEYISSLYRSQELPIFFSATFNGLQQTLGGGEQLQRTDKNYKELADIIKREFGVSKFNEGDAILLSEGIQFLINLAKEEAEAAYAAATQKERDNDEVKPFAKMDILSANLISNEDSQHKEENLEHYKKFIKTPSFWAEGHAIIIFEKALNIKTIIVSEEGTIAAMATAKQKGKKMPTYKDYSAVMCEGPDTTNPDYYIITTKSANHYRLITYNGKGIFKNFNDLPTKLKDMIVMLNCPSYNNIREVMEHKARRGEARSGGTRRRNKGGNNKKSRRRR